MNKTIFVTGATKGIGRAISQQFASQGFNVMACARNLSDLESMQKELQKLYPNQVFEFIQADLSKKTDRNKVVGFISKQNIDVLVNNAGIFIPGTIHQEENGVLEQMIETNLYSAYDLTRALVPQMKSRQKGVIFNICSTASIMAYPNGGSYCISKFALLGFSKVLREELKEFGIKVTSILPGATYTASWEGVDLPETRFMPATDVAKSIWDVYGMSDRTVIEELILRPQLGDLA
jgi:short-subunit dehydrogenase